MSRLPLRHVARVVLVDAAGAALLCRYSEAGLVYWVPPGGALEQGEDHRTAALRELREETGLTTQIGVELWNRRFVLHMKSGPVDQVERYFLARLATERPVVGKTTAEDIEELRWWTLRELQTTVDRIYPDGFVEQLQALLSDSISQ